jgi:hypothetical protein
VVLVFVFSHNLMVGNYNYVTPYCHEVVHGLVLAIVTVMWLSDWVETKRIRFAAAAGFGSGLVFLTKPDVFLALLVTVVAALVVAGLYHRQTAWAAKSVAAGLLAGLVPLLVFFALFFRVENWRASAGAVVSAWAPLWHASVTRDPFYQWCLGLDMPWQHLERMMGQFVILVAIIAVYTLAFRRGMESRFKWVRPFWLVWPLLILPLLVLAAKWNWVDCGRSLPLLILVAGGLLILRYRQNPTKRVAVFPLLWMVFSLALMSKLGVYPRIWHYGFVLAMPAFVGAVYLFVWLLPSLLEQKYCVRAPVFRGVICLVLMIGFVRLFARSEYFYLHKDTLVGNGGDKIMAYNPTVDPFHSRVEIALSWLETNVPPAATLAVLPEGAMINYLSRRVNPTRFLAWVPPVMTVFGQTNMNTVFEQQSPDCVIVIARSASEFGVGFFGYDPRYGADLKRWLDEHYDQVYPAPDPAAPSAAGEPPFHGLQILKRRPPDFPGEKF